MPRRILLVEGSDDQHVMWALFQAHQVPDGIFEVVKAQGDGGIDQLLATIPVRIKQSDLECLGIIVDADEAIDSRWEQLRTVLINNGCVNVPASPLPAGTIMTIPEGARVGVWIMPNNELPGSLESFLAFLAPVGDPLLRYVDQFLAGIPIEHIKFPTNRAPKARIHAFLAVQNQPGKPLGQAISAKYLDADAQVVAPLLQWVRAALIE